MEDGLNKILLLLTVFEPHLTFSSLAPALPWMSASTAMEHRDHREQRFSACVCTYVFVNPTCVYVCVCVHLRTLSVFFRPPEATQMNEALDQVSRAILPSMCCSWPRGILSSVSARPLGEEVKRGRVTVVRKKMKRV